MSETPTGTCPSCRRVVASASRFCRHCGAALPVAGSGWYPDPYGQSALRFWDGSGWSGYTAAPEASNVKRPASLSGKQNEVGLRGMGIAVVGFGIGVGLSFLVERVWVLDGRPGGIAAILAVSELALWAGLVAAVVYVSVRRGSANLSRDFGLRVRPRDIGIGLLGAIVGRSASIVVALPLYAAFHNLIHHPQVGIPVSRINGAAWIVFALTACIGAPFVEELFFRGLIQTRLVMRWGAVKGIAATSVLFGAAHLIGWVGLGSLLAAAAIAGSGAVLGFLRYRTGRLGTSMIAHSAFNMAAVALLYFTSV